jgi:hypothetical protein
MSIKPLLVWTGFAAIAFATQAASHQSSERYRGHFMYSWEGGGFFIPCNASPGEREEGLGRTFFAYLRSDSIRWPRGVRPFRSHEGETTFVVLRVPRLVGPGGDTVHRPFSADVDSLRRPSATDCRR